MSTLFAEKLDLSEFPAATMSDWKAAAEATLKGKPLEKLTSRTPDGLTVDPIYQRDHGRALPGAENDPGVFPYVRGSKLSADWETVQEGLPAVPAGGVRVDAARVHEHGGTAVQEVAAAWLEGLQALRDLEAKGDGIDAAAGKIRFAFAAGGEFFVVLAKLRAARYGWARIVTASGGSPEAAKMVIHARTARWEQSSLDPHTNMLRATAAAYAAVLGGCDSLTVAPFDEVFREPDEFSQRLARNTQAVLREECRAEVVADPAGGAWFVETLTAEIAQAAWAEFQTAQAPDVNSAGKAQRESVSQRRRVLVGVNQYADPYAKPLASTRNTQVERLAGGFEALRANAWDYAAKHGEAPKIFLLTMGPLKQHKARADFVRGFLEPGGFAVLYPSGFETAAEAVEAAKQSGALAAVLCSTDETYPELAPAVLAEMREAMPVMLAGYPADHVEAFQAAGLADFIHLKADCGAFLATWQKKLGVAP
jgi:methylmalonyl-CoA mutase